jgi:N-acetylglucosaminyl-diphospho-decaprenol L-rhamnosyltransferase
MDLSVIIVNWNSKDYLRECIASVVATVRDIEYEILVIDSASLDGCDMMLHEHYPRARFIQSNKNLGFAGANNTAFRQSKGRTTLFLNPDTEVIGPAINTMYDCLWSLPGAEAVGCKLLNGDGTVQTSCVQSFPTILNQLLDSEFLRAIWPKSPFWGMAPLFGGGNEPKEVEALSGACIMLKRALFEQVGLFCEDYFMYAEDVDLCYKIRHLGHKCFYVPNASVIHFGGGSTQNTPSEFSVVMMRESIWRFLRKTQGELYGVGYRASMLISAIGRIGFLMILLPVQIIRRGSESWKASLHKWGSILTWSLGLYGRQRKNP